MVRPKANRSELLWRLRILLRAAINSARRPHHLKWFKDATEDGVKAPLQLLEVLLNGGFGSHGRHVARRIAFDRVPAPDIARPPKRPFNARVRPRFSEEESIRSAATKNPCETIWGSSLTRADPVMSQGPGHQNALRSLAATSRPIACRSFHAPGASEIAPIMMVMSILLSCAPPKGDRSEFSCKDKADVQEVTTSDIHPRECHGLDLDIAEITLLRHRHSGISSDARIA